MSPETETMPQPWEDLVLRAPARPAGMRRPEARAQTQKPQLPAPRPSKDQLAASYLTHELRAPLTSIRSALSLIQEQANDNLDADAKHMLELAVRNTDRLARLINDIMDFSKVEAGKLKIEPAPAGPRQLLQDAVDCLQAWALTRSIKLVRRSDEEPLPRVMADDHRIVQVLTNLISNALKFTPAGGRVEVSAKLGKREHAGTVIFSVKDTGCGINPEDLDRIFHAFEQSAAGNKVSDGTGLGLMLAKAMVELHGGRIWVESWKGLGTTFRFSLPIVKADLPKPVAVYPKPVEYHGMLLDLFKRLNSVVAYFV